MYCTVEQWTVETGTGTNLENIPYVKVENLKYDSKL